MIYDLIIVGAGPSGLALAQCMTDVYNNILIIEKLPVIGGCHRVLRVPYTNSSGNIEEVFTEHSPRIYSNSYSNFITLLKKMNADFYKMFTPYNFSMLDIGGQTAFKVLSAREVFLFGLQFLSLIFDSNHGENISIGDFMTQNNFSESAKDMINRMCRLTDGGGIDKYTLNEFLELFNQQIFYQIYQPIVPNDQGLFKIWKDYLSSTGKVTFMLNTPVEKLILDTNTGLLKSVVVSNNSSLTTTPNAITIQGSKIVLALTHPEIPSILENSEPEVQNAFMVFEQFKEFSQYTAYLTYISFTFHWDTDLKLPKIYGFPKSEWGLAFIVLTDYMTFTESVSKTVITCTFTFTDVVSSNIGKTANQCGEDEILAEGMRQLREAYPTLPEPTLKLLSPQMYKIGDGSTQLWQMGDKAFITTTKGFIPFNSYIPNLYNLGTQNGHQSYKFTSMESAVTNAMYLAHELDPRTKNNYKIKRLFTFTKLILLILISILTIILFIVIINIR